MTSQRMLKVGEQIRRILSQIIQSGGIHSADGEVMATISEVKVSPDLKIASVYMSSFDVNSSDTLILRILKENAAVLRKLLGQKLKMKFTPELRFFIDSSFEDSSRLKDIFSSPHVSQDLSSDDS